MKLELQCCSLEQSKRLDWHGVTPSHTAFTFRFDAGMKWRIEPDGYFDPNEEHVESFPAYTLAEICSMLTSDEIEAVCSNAGFSIKNLTDQVIYNLDYGRITTAMANDRLNA